MSDIGPVEQPDACPSLGYGNEAGTCPKHPNGQRFAFYDKDYGDLNWRCWEGENATRAAALRQAGEALHDMQSLFAAIGELIRDESAVRGPLRDVVARALKLKTVNERAIEALEVKP